ncbi:MAG: hypothetical protein A3F68_00540 [Acidobacteria bacterium RIFCSPLOWO2_12_FULL_54_10]|nr:MAG: hypothetical protein A3F68_00540 [Acidobacteria bacterium RIFCSPLOWO2_12_FULL_54_10]
MSKMNQSRILLALGLTMIGFLTDAAIAGRRSPKENAPFLLEEKYKREPDPKQRVLIAIKLSDLRFKELRTVYMKGAASLQQETSASFLLATELIAKAVNDATDSGYSKKCEQHLRRQMRSLEDLKMDVSYQVRPALDAITKQVAGFHEKILYSLMNPVEHS